MSESVNIRELNDLVASKNDFVQLIDRCDADEYHHHFRIY